MHEVHVRVAAKQRSKGALHLLRVGVLEILPRDWLVAPADKKFTWSRPLRVRLILRGGRDERAKAA